MKKGLWRSQSRNKVILTGGAYSNVYMGREGLVGLDQQAVPLTRNVLLETEKKCLTGSEALMKPLDDSIQCCYPPRDVTAGGAVKTIPVPIEMRDDDQDFPHGVHPVLRNDPFCSNIFFP
jgi:hypothetical protein